MGIFIVLLAMLCAIGGAYNIGTLSTSPPDDTTQQKYNTSLVIVAIAIAMALCGLFSVQTNWNPFANVGGMVSRNAAGQNKAAAALGLL